MATRCDRRDLAGRGREDLRGTPAAQQHASTCPTAISRSSPPRRIYSAVSTAAGRPRRTAPALLQIRRHSLRTPANEWSMLDGTTSHQRPVLSARPAGNATAGSMGGEPHDLTLARRPVVRNTPAPAAAQRCPQRSARPIPVVSRVADNATQTSLRGPYSRVRSRAARSAHEFEQLRELARVHTAAIQNLDRPAILGRVA
jgi:hypothetical protein